ncbi:N-acetyltransferase [Sphingomonas canadensis]|uniref:N-acetyltransferase n=1 Tax=Sphingomonas canadensis TaxID=1219257 RepID=A0ABW3H2N0_9SPHN|nr:N-acetyltransferase [Sphingomonas canadensis]MCW3835855.1 N-acetyltransferase [Sphingomonas canadensis]
MANAPVTVRPVVTKADRKAFIDLAYRINAKDPAWVPPLKSEFAKMIDPKDNGWFSHAEGQLFLAERGGRVTGRISAHIDTLALEMPVEQGFGPGTGFWGLVEAEDAETMAALVAQAEAWLKAKGMTRALGPVSMSVWEEPGLLVRGHDHSPTIMMGHNLPEYQGWIEALGYRHLKSLLTYELDVSKEFPPLVQRIVAQGERNPSIRIREVDKGKFHREAQIILDIMNDAWSGNWGFVPLTQREVDDVGKKMKPLVYKEMIRIAELDGEPVAFMIALPDMNEAIKPFGGNLLPFNWIKLLRWLHRPRARTARVPLMGVRKKLQSSRLTMQLAFMMISYIRRATVSQYGSTRGEIGWILDDNSGMIAIADAINSQVNREYVIYERPIA